MAKKAEAWKQYSEGAYLEMIIKKLPEITKELSRPLGNTDNVVIVGQSGASSGGDMMSDRFTKEMSNLLAQLPPVVQGLTGIDINEALKKKLGQ